MLKYLNIKNIAIINECKIEFGDNFNCLTGETGAGKSIIIDSLNFVLGAKLERNLINSKSDFAQVDALFDISDFKPEVKNCIYSLLSDECDEVQISRHMASAGKSTFKVNGDNVSGTIVKKIASFLVDVFGQSDHSLLNNKKYQLAMLDLYVIEKDKNLLTLKEQLKEKLNSLSEINNSIDELGGVGDEKNSKIELLSFEIDEIESANLKINEDEELNERKKIILNSEKIYNCLDDSISEIYKHDVLNLIKYSSNSFKSIESFSEQYSVIKDKLLDVKFTLEDIVEEINELKNTISYSENELNEIQERIDLINDLKRKYGNSVEDIINLLDVKKEELEKLLNSDAELAKLLKQKNLILNDISDISNQISNLRKKYSTIFEDELINNVVELGMKNSKFKISFSDFPNIDDIENCVDETGCDEIEFLFSANLGQELKPLSKVLSGGEMSRFVLAFKSILGGLDNNKTYIFDEIDTGIGGLIGSVVGKKIAKISKENQVICITHLAQIACFADNNYKIEKKDVDNKTIAGVHLLNSNDVVNEVSRMIGSLQNNEYANLHAKELIKEANEFKVSYK